MSDTITRDERRSALDQFANRPSTDSAQAMTTVSVQPPAEIIYGNREVAAQRDESRVLSRIRTLAAAAGSSWYYRYPVKNKRKGTTEWIEGPSIELALDIARIYGNCHVDCRAQDLGGVVLFHARFHDIESGFSLTRPFQQRKGAAKMGGGDQGRNDEIDFSIGASKAIRNVIVNALKTYANFAFEEAQGAIVDKIGKNIERWRADTIANLKVDLTRVEAVIGRAARDWLAPDIAKVRATGKAIEDGMATWNEAFPPLGVTDTEVVDEATGEVLDRFAAVDERAQLDPAGAGQDTAGTVDRAPASEVPADVRYEIIDRLIRLTTEPGGEQERLESLDVASTMLGDLYPDKAAFLKTAISYTAKVIKGELSAVDARNYLKGVVK